MSRDTKSSVQTVAITKSTVAKANRRPQSISGTNACQEQLTASPFDPIKKRSSTRYYLLRPLHPSTRLPSYAIYGQSHWHEHELVGYRFNRSTACLQNPKTHSAEHDSLEFGVALGLQEGRMTISG